MDRLFFASLMADNAAGLYAGLCTYLARRLGLPVEVIQEVPWQEREQMLYRGEAHLGAMCGLQYVYASARGESPGVELLVAPVMQAPRYAGRPMYFSDVVVRQESPARSLADLRGARWAYNEPTSQSGYNITRYTLAVRGETSGFFGRVVASGAHQQSLQLVLAGLVDASAIDSTVLEQELRVRPELRRRLRVIETLGPSPIPPLVVSRTVPTALRTAIRTTLLELHGEPLGGAVLGTGAIARFVPVADADYDPIRDMAQVAATVRLRGPGHPHW
jgi:phosphonate transport system substrate-binding protein